MAVKATLESDWNAFEADVQKYIDAADEQIGVREAAFRAGMDAQMKAWQEAAGKLQNAAAGFAADRRAEVEAIEKRMKDDAAAAQAKLDKARRAGSEILVGLEYGSVGDARRLRTSQSGGAGCGQPRPRVTIGRIGHGSKERLSSPALRLRRHGAACRRPWQGARTPHTIEVGLAHDVLVRLRREAACATQMTMAFWGGAM